MEHQILNLDMTKILVHKHIIKFFVDKNRVSCARVYFYVKNVLGNHLHSSQYSQVCSDLSISDKVLFKCLRQLEELGVGYYYTRGYFRINSWKKWIGEKDSKQRTCREVSLDELKSNKTLRNIYYVLSITKAYYRARKIERKLSKSNSENVHGASDYKDVSSEFVTMVNGMHQHRSTINRHIIKANGKFIHKKKNQELVHTCNDANEALAAIHYFRRLPNNVGKFLSKTVIL